MTRVTLAATLVLATLAASQPGVAAPGALLWSDRFDRARGDDRFEDVAVAGGRVFAVGRTATDSAEPDALVRCYDAASGAPCWEDFFDLAGGEDEATAVAVRGHRLFVAGSAESASGDADFLLRAYDTRTGLLLWQDLYDPEGKNDRASAVAVRGGTVFVAGTVESFIKERLVVRAYDARTGALRWQNVFEPQEDVARAHALGASGRRVVVAGAAESRIDEDDFLVHGIERRGGATAFDDLVDGARHDNDGAADLALGGGTAFAVGRLNNLVGDMEGSIDLVVRAYDLSQGALLWQDVVGEFESGYSAHAVALAGGRLAVAGSRRVGVAESDFLVRCYAPRSGKLLWDDTLDVAGGHDAAYAVAAAGGTVVVGGSGTDDVGVLRALVRGYDAASGKLRFEDLAEGEIDDGTVRVAADGGRAFVTSAVLAAAQPETGVIADAVIRAYDLR